MTSPHEPEAPVTQNAGPIAVLVGPPGAGKSTIGRRLARALGVNLIDTDQLIAESCGEPCGEAYSRLGDAKFRTLEHDKVVEALRTSGIVSLGGGAVTHEDTRALLDDQLVIWLDVSASVGLERTMDEPRPILQTEDPAAQYRMLLEQRNPLYKEVASMRAKTDNRTPQQVVAEILSYLEAS